MPIRKHFTWPELFSLSIIISVGSFLRLYRIPETLQFLGDQGRDAIVVKEILQGDFTLLGPVTSVGNMYLGPFYYYFMAPFSALTYPNPIGPAYGVALMGILTIVLVYYFVRKIFDRNTAIVSALVYAAMNQAVFFSRFSWNPNIAPIFGLIIFYSIYKTLEEKNYKYLVLAYFSFGLIIQLHYLALILVGFIAGANLFLFFKKYNQVDVSPSVFS